MPYPSLHLLNLPTPKEPPAAPAQAKASSRPCSPPRATARSFRTRAHLAPARSPSAAAKHRGTHGQPQKQEPPSARLHHPNNQYRCERQPDLRRCPLPPAVVQTPLPHMRDHRQLRVLLLLLLLARLLPVPAASVPRRCPLPLASSLQGAASAPQSIIQPVSWGAIHPCTRAGCGGTGSAARRP